MRIGIPRESRPGETLVAATAKTASQLAALGYDVVVETGAGVAADQPDTAFAEAGIAVGTGADVWSSDVVVKVDAPTDDEIGRLRPGATVVSLMAPARSPELVERLAAQGVTALAMDAVPRISRAQSMDVLSSMANVAGYRAVIEAAHEFGRLFTGQVTAAGKVPPARVFVVGAGVAGLAAIGAAGSLGAVVRAFDVRPEVAEQVESMGAQFVTVDMEQEVSSDGYAKEMTAEQEAATAAMYDEEARAADIVITTALIPGRPAPRLITAETVAAMRPGSVVVDMAAANGGNVAATVEDERVVTANGVTVLGYTDLAGRLAAQTSQLYGTNVVNLMKLLTPGKDGVLTLDLDDVVQRGITVTRSTGEGAEVMWPPPPVQVSAAPAPAAPAAVEKQPPPPPDPRRRLYAAGLAAVVFLALATAAPVSFLPSLTVFVLAVVIGFYVIGNVHHALHTPLMSVTNAISGIIVVGAILQAPVDNLAVQLVAGVAILLASINVFGGFLVTRRMLNMFQKG
ncbi:Re/Si-specific NAD(P)(+) transhydrogenase subunit alpha [Nocardioides sp. zg-1228]|uniref:Re/Si-specific NAD(P)(+) transhydrogenase subunit alpha n=1 Tax=Nocardioides sp. zg-1228 TaxID=2763008 RepID=UPI0016430998|nr:Re/Si-specific NAD(P)(+) transhydrogenase subunit alpha [Nocardioides sp. zg-1228]MBC2932289.1 Re/Si-specific NAD(P)(+) transhydrogenase subunit alpha [Nocardioides sp. zg-1228]QSF57810.1 Re/Si-specific NAD(P)(+) transhydrogenase subunit alpha [Nocardioides sp. zg-1228]